MTAAHAWRRRARAVVLAGLGVAFLTAGAAAQQADAPRREARMRGGMPLAHLNLSADQQASVKAIMTEQRTANEATGKALREAHDELRAAIYGSATPDAAKIEELTTRISGLEADALRARIATQVKIAGVLTDEQRKEMASAERGGFGPRGRGRHLR